MGSLSPLHWMIVLAVALLLFGGGGKISGLMGDMAKGIKSFKKNMADEDASMEASAEKPPGNIKGPVTPGATASNPQSTATNHS